MTQGWFTLVVGILLLLWGGGVLLKERLLAWCTKKQSAKLLGIVNVVVGAFLIYIAAVLL